MKTKILAITIASVFVLGSQAQFFGADHNWNNGPSVSAAVEVSSLRGLHGLDSLSIAPSRNKFIKDGDWDRSFDDQPPLIPHKSEGMPVNLSENKCLSCHSQENYKEEDASKMSGTHFMTRDDERLKNLSPRRYFCIQCHVPQVDREALIGNTYVNLDE